VKEWQHHPDGVSRGEKYPAKAHARAVAKKLGLTRGLIFIPGTPTLTYEDSDMGGEFHQQRFFYYITGIDEPDLNVVYDLEYDTLTLFIRERTDVRDIIFNGPSLSMEDAFEKYEIDRVGYNDVLEDYLRDFLKSDDGDLLVVHEWHLDDFRLPKTEKIDIRSLQPAMQAARVIKDQYEIRQIREANRVSGMAHREVLKYVSKLNNETAVEAIFIGTSLHYGAKHQAYNPIAAAGTNAATLHYMKNDDTLVGKELICLDAGAEWGLYAADVTRTFPISGNWASYEAEVIYNLVLAMQTVCIHRMRPGTLYRDLYVLAHYTAVVGLKKLGILHHGTVEEIVKAGTSLAFFPHGLGHHIGLDVHDAFDRDSSLSSKAVLPFGLDLSSPRPFGADIPVSDAALHDQLFQDQYRNLIHDESSRTGLSFSNTALRENMVVTVEPGM
jgi:Xaa-Pro aminopeptidase